MLVYLNFMTVEPSEPLIDLSPEEPVIAEEPTAPTEPDTPDAPPEPAAVEGITFTSLESDTAKVIVRCDEEKARGAESATIEMAAATSCSVTAIRSDRSRLTAVVANAETGSYRCFEGGESKCERD